MGRAAGTGSPIFFHCPAWRGMTDRERAESGPHRITLTGKTRPFRPSGARGQRSTFTARQWECSCGRSGWSAHVDLERLANRPEPS